MLLKKFVRGVSILNLNVDKGVFFKRTEPETNLNDWQHFKCPKCNGDIIKCVEEHTINDNPNHSLITSQNSKLVCADCNTQYSICVNNVMVSYRILEVE